MASTKLLRVLATPSNVASALDWKKVSGATVLNLDIHADRIGLAIASHPSHQEEVKTLPDIKLASPRKIPPSVQQRLSDVVNDYNVCGFVVSWPVQQDTGKLGASCGRVLFTLENILNDTTNNNNSVMTPNRPVCLWDSVHMEQPPTDDWGRNPVYARTTNQTLHLASKEQYHQDENIVAAQVWEDFVQTHWPTIHQQKKLYNVDDDLVVWDESISHDENERAYA